jgi:hypothetical protein
MLQAISFLREAVNTLFHIVDIQYIEENLELSKVIDLDS